MLQRLSPVFKMAVESVSGMIAGCLVFCRGDAADRSFSSSKITYENGEERGLPVFGAHSCSSGDFFRCRTSLIEMVLGMIQSGCTSKNGMIVRSVYTYT